MDKPSLRDCIQKFASADQEVREAICLMLCELEDARKKHPNWKNDYVWRAAVVVEEAGELVRATLNEDKEEMMLEAVQTGAMALRFLTEKGM